MSKIVLKTEDDITDFLTYKVNYGIDAYFSIKNNPFLRHIVFKRNQGNHTIHNGYVSIISLKVLDSAEPALIPGDMLIDKKKEKDERYRYYDILISSIEMIEFD